MATTSPSVPALAEQLRIAVARTARRMRQEGGGELGPTLVAALATVERHGPLTPSELAAREGVRRPTASRIVAKLEAQGLVERSGDPDDGRSSLLSPTAGGRELLRDLRTRKGAFLARRLEALSPADRALLARAAELLEGLLDEGERS
jgi:DNA-binding MarR family transcriptional regulator